MYTNPLTEDQRHRRIQGYIDRMASLSTTVTKVIEVCDKPDASPNDLNKIISLDPVLTGRVLRLINSAYYSLPNKITTLTRAIIMLGLNTVKNLALSTAVLGTKMGGASSGFFSADQFWAHSLTVGVTAKLMAVEKKVPVMQREDYFVAGLLHDLGKMPLTDCFPQEYPLVLQLIAEKGLPIEQAEKEVLTLDHGQSGKMIAEKWQLSEIIINALEFHHRPFESPEENRAFVAFVSLADLFANKIYTGDITAGDQPDEKFAGILDAVGLQLSDLFALEEVVAAEIEKAQIFLQVAHD